MTSAIFRSDEGRKAVEQAYERFLAETPQARSLRVPTRLGETHLLVAGPEHAPPVVVLHGAMVSSASALREGHPLLEHFRVYAVDIIGQSVKSADVRVRLDRGAHADWLRDVFDALHLPRAHVTGASSGGYIARAFAERAPERVDRLVLLVPAGIIKPPALRLMTKLVLPMLHYRATGSRAALDRFVDATFTVQDPALRDYFSVALAHYKLDFSIPPLATAAGLAGFQRPTLIVAAADDVTAPGARLLARARQVLPHARLELLPWKHVPPTDDVSRAKLCGLITDFLLAEAAPTRSVAGSQGQGS